jgi:hypothetical protein
MIEFFRAGGFTMWVVLLFGGISLVAAVRFARHPDVGRVSGIRAMSAATIFAIVSGVAANVTAVMKYVSEGPGAREPDLARLVLAGLGEALAPAILGFTLLSLSWLLVAVGARRARHADS